MLVGSSALLAGLAASQSGKDSVSAQSLVPLELGGSNVAPGPTEWSSPASPTNAALLIDTAGTALAAVSEPDPTTAALLGPSVVATIGVSLGATATATLPVPVVPTGLLASVGYPANVTLTAEQATSQPSAMIAFNPGGTGAVGVGSPGVLALGPFAVSPTARLPASALVAFNPGGTGAVAVGNPALELQGSLQVSAGGTFTVPARAATVFVSTAAVSAASCVVLNFSSPGLAVKAVDVTPGVGFKITFKPANRGMPVSGRWCAIDVA